MSKIETDGVLKYAPDEIGACDRGKIYDKDKLDCVFNNCDATVLY